jgi:hypothetical protein
MYIISYNAGYGTQREQRIHKEDNAFQQHFFSFKKRKVPCGNKGRQLTAI